MTDVENRRCRASVWDESGWRRHQCTRRAKDYRDFNGGKCLPACGTHLRVRYGVDEYVPRDAYDAAAEAVVR